MNINVTDFRSENITHIARVLSPIGCYSNKEIILGEAAYVPDPIISFSFYPYRRPSEDALYSEVHWLYDEEIRLYAAIIMALDPDEGSLSIYPCHHAHIFLSCRNQEIGTKDFICRIRDLIVKNLQTDERYNNNYYYPSIFPWLHKLEYDLKEKKIDCHLAKLIHESIDLNDAVLMRGLLTLIKAGMLKQQSAFYEEGINSLFISLEASFRLILRKLKQRGISNPTSKDAAKFLHDAFHDADRLEHYFEEYYKRRVISFHPESRHGLYPYPLLQVDDLYFLYSDLLGVYRFLIAGYIHPRHI